MAYVQPQMRIFQQFEAAVAAGLVPLNAAIVGQNKSLHGRSGDTCEVGLYSDVADQATALPETTTGGIIDASTVKVEIRDAKLAYYTGTNTVFSLNGSAPTNKLTSTKTLKNSDGFTRDAVFGTRDVSVGDYVSVTGTGGTKLSKIIALTQANVSAAFGTATKASSNVGIVDPTKSGTYSGAENTVYIVRVVSDCTLAVGSGTISLNVSTDDGYDTRATVGRTNTGTVNIGSYGLVLTFGAGDYKAGDIWTISATAEGKGAYTGITLADKLVDGVTNITTITSVEMCAVETVTLASTQYSYDADLKKITVNSGATADSLVTGLSDCAIVEGTVNFKYDEFLVESSGSISDASGVEAVLGTISPDNPLAYGVYKALLNSNGTTVYYENVGVDGWSSALERLTASTVVHGVVPLTADNTVKELFSAFADTQSNETNNNWKIVWLYNDEATSSKMLVETYATFTNVSSKGHLVFDNGNDIVTLGVRAGDIVRYNYEGSTYSTGIVDEVDNITELDLTAAVDGTLVNTRLKVQVWQTRTISEWATAVAADSASWSNRRVRNIFRAALTVVDSEGVSVPGYFLAAALAGLRSGSAPHAPLTNVEITGFDSSFSAVFSNDQLNTMAASGTWLVVTDRSGNLYSRHQLTTDNSSLEMREDSITTALDAISRVYRDQFAGLVGRGNVSDEMIRLLEARTRGASNYLMSLPFESILGPLLQDYSITELARDTYFKDRVVIRIKPTIAYPLNNLDVYLTVG